MPVKTITAEIDGQVRKIRADVPDGASQDDIMSAVTEWSSTHSGVPGMEKLGALPKAGQLPKDAVKYPPLSAQGQSESMYEAKYGVPPSEHLHEGGLGTILNTMTLAPAIAGNPIGTGVSLGAGALTGTGMRAGAKRLGVPEDIANLVGAISGLGATILTAPRAGLLQKGLQQWKNPAVRGALSKIWSKSGMGGWSELETALNPPAVPYPAGKGTGTKYGGPATSPEYTARPGTTIPRKGLTPPIPVAGKGTGTKYGGPAAPEYGAPGKLILRKTPTPPIPEKTVSYPAGKGTGTKYGGSEDPYGGRSYRRTPPRASRVNPTETEEAIREPKPAKEASLGSKLRESIKHQQAKNKFRNEASHRANVTKVANFLKSSGVDPEMANGATRAQKLDLLKEANAKHFSDLDTAWDEVIDEMQGKSWPARGTSPMPPSKFTGQ